ncbi:hypothetical protein ACIRPK_34975 [Kitasatospora sp. NPDC101801]|uniref:hypothetical protein n=1 Tax=Kitasatospora sp. NPDC101801 TaxID=3364103 RepID=UPI003823DBAD
MTDHRLAPLPGAAAAGLRAPAAAWDLRLARAVPFALVCTLIAAAGHALVGDGEVGTPALVTGFAAVCALAVLLGGRERSMAAIAGALSAGQLGLHLLFHFLCGPAMPGMHHGGGLTLPQVASRLVCDESGTATLVDNPGGVVSAAGLDPAAYPATAGPEAAGWLGLTGPMLLGHLAAAVLAGWWLRRGEAALWRLLRLTAEVAQEFAAPLRTAFALLLTLLLGPATTGRPRPGAPRAGDWRLPGAAALRHSLLRRGPPVATYAR